MAQQLAQAGVLTCVIQYSLYPDALAPQMVDELSQALTWTFNNIGQHGGNSSQVAAVPAVPALPSMILQQATSAALYASDTQLICYSSSLHDCAAQTQFTHTYIDVTCSTPGPLVTPNSGWQSALLHCLLHNYGRNGGILSLCQQVSLVGHSAGAQMCAMALLHRAKALSKHKQSHQSINKSGQTSGQDSQLPTDVRMPAKFIGTPRVLLALIGSLSLPATAGASAPAICLVLNQH